jgi:hypothetical protein
VGDVVPLLRPADGDVILFWRNNRRRRDRADNGGSAVGTGLIAGILIAVLVIVGLVIVGFGGFDFRGTKDVNVKVETPDVKASDLPDAGNKGR